MSASCTHKTFTNQTQTTYVITLSGNTGSVTELIGYGEVFNLEYEKIDPTKLHSSPIQSGRLEFNMLVRDADDQTILSNIFNSDEGSYSLSITQQVDDGAVKTLFSGSVLNDMLEISEADYPHEANIVAKDFTGLKGKAYDLVSDTEFVSIKTLISDLITPIRGGKSITYHTNYENDNVSGSFLDGTFVDKFGLRDFKEAETRDDDLPLDRYEILESLLKSFGLIMRQAEGAFRVYQLSSLSGVPTTTIDKNSKYILPSSLTQFNGGIKRASFAYNHRTVVKEINLPDRFSLSYDPDEQTVEEGLALKRDFSQVFNSEQDIRLHFRIDAEFPPREQIGSEINFVEANNKFGRFQIKIVSASNTYYFKLGESNNVNIANTRGEWVTEPTTNAVRLIGGGDLEGAELQTYNNVINLTIDNVPADADGNLTLSFINSAKAELNNGSVQEFIEGSRRTTFSINEFAITSTDNRGNSDTLSYQIEQDGDFSTTYEHGTVLFGEGPVSYSPLALHYEATPPGGGLIPTPGEYELILGGWSRGSGTAVTLAELLLQELIGNQSRGTRNLSAELYGNYNGHDKVLYDGVTYFMIGGVLNGNNVFSANFIELNFATDDLGSLTESAENVRSSIGGGFSTDDLLNFQTALKASQFFNTIFLSNFIGELSSSILAGSTITSFTANLSAQIRAGEDFVLVDKENERPFFVNVVADPDTGAEEYNTGENVVVHVEEQFIKNDLPVGSPVILAGGLLESYFTIDPTKLLISVEEQAKSFNFGELQDVYTDEVSSKTSLSISNPDVSATNFVQFTDGQHLRIRRKDGQSQVVRVDGNQTFTSSPYTVNLQSFNPAFDVVGLSAPLNNLRLRAVLEPTNIGSTVASIEIKANDNEASITSLTSFTNDINDSLATVEQKANANEASITQSVQFDDSTGEVRLVAGPGGSEFSVVADQVNIDATTTFASGYDPSEKVIPEELNITVTGTTVPLQGESPRADGSFIEGDLFYKTDEGNRPYRFDAGLDQFIKAVTVIDGGEITTGFIDADRIQAGTIDASKIDVADLFAEQITIDSSTGSIQSTGFSSGSSGFKIEGNGSAEFQSVTIGGSTSTVGNNAKLEDLSITGTLTLDTGELKATNSGNSVTLDATGITGVDNVLGTTFRLPTNGDAPTFSSGVINETIYEISTNAILRTSSTALDGSASSAGVLINNTGIFAGEANQNTGNANVRIGADGSAFFSGGIVAGSGSIDGPTEVTTLLDVNGNIAKYGDVNLNGVITVEDALITLSHSVGKISLGSYQQYIADVTDNGDVTSLDASRILSYVAGGGGGTPNLSGQNAVDTGNPFYTDCKLEFNTNDSFMQGTGEDRDSNTETFFRIAPFNSFINLLRTDFLSSEYLYAETVRPNAIVGAPSLRVDTSYLDTSLVDRVGRTDVFGAIKIDNENNSDGDPATGTESFGLDVIGDTRLQGELRFDGTTHTSASAGTNGDVPSQVVGYIQVNVGGTDYKIPYYS